MQMFSCSYISIGMNINYETFTIIIIIAFSKNSLIYNNFQLLRYLQIGSVYVEVLFSNKI